MKRNESLLYDAHFREIFHRTVFIELKEMEPIASSVDVLPDANGVIAYGFQEERANMTFLVFASARLDEPEDESLPVITPEEFIESLEGVGGGGFAEAAEMDENLAEKLKKLREQGHLILLMTAGPADKWFREQFAD